MALPFENDTGTIAKKLSKQSMLSNKVRSFVTVIAIITTALLFASIATLTVGTAQSVQLSMQMMKGSKVDADLHYLSEEQFQRLKKSDFVREAGLRMPVGFLTNTQKHNIELDVMDKTEMEMTFLRPAHGSIPQQSNEVVASDAALRDLGIEPEIGAQMIIELNVRGENYRFPMEVSGWYESRDPNISVMVVPPSFKDAHPELFQNTFVKDREMVGTYYSDIYVKKTAGLEKQLKDFVTSAGGSNDGDSPRYIGFAINSISNPTIDPLMIAAVLGVVVLFVFCGYLLIYNIFDIAVMQDIRRYGLYRTIGMSKRQMKKIIKKQALTLSLIGIPIGLILGYLIGYAVLPVITEMFSFEMRGFLATEVSPNPLIFIISGILTAFTVYISTRKPIRTISKIAPIEAFCFVEEAATKKAVKKRSKVSVSKMAWENLRRNKRRSIFIVISLTLCIVLLNVAEGLSGSVDIGKIVAEYVRTDFTVASTDAFNKIVAFSRYENRLPENVITDVAAQTGIENASVICKNTLDDSNVTYDLGLDFDKIEPTSLGIPDVYDGQNQNGDYRLGADKFPLCHVVGMDKNALSRLILWKGETDLDRLWEQLQNGEGLLIGEPKERGLTAPDDNQMSDLKVGDTITIRVDGTPLKSLPILAKALYIYPAIGVSDNMGCGKVGGDAPAVFLPASQFGDIYATPAILKYEFDVADGAYEEMDDFLHSYTQNHTNVNYSSSEQQKSSGESIKSMILLVGGLLALIFAFTGILNLINMLISNILVRRREFATLQSVGMTKKQLRRMVVFESLYYTLLASVFGILLAIAVNGTALKIVCGSIWFMSYSFVLLPALIACCVMMILSLVIAPLLLKWFQKGSIVERLRETE